MTAYALSYNSRAVTNEILGTAAEILSLSPARVDLRIPLSVTGVVTVAEPNWQGQILRAGFHGWHICAQYKRATTGCR
jgi:hypothetical protein